MWNIGLCASNLSTVLLIRSLNFDICEAVAAISVVAWLGLGVYKSREYFLGTTFPISRCSFPAFYNGWRVLLSSQAIFVLVPIVIFHGKIVMPSYDPTKQCQVFLKVLVGCTQKAESKKAMHPWNVSVGSPFRIPLSRHSGTRSWLPYAWKRRIPVGLQRLLSFEETKPRHVAINF